MYKVAILGCENSHADSFLAAVIENKIVDDVEFVGVYSDDTEAAQKLTDRFGVYVANSYDEFVGKVDGIIITARHGDNHYKYAKPYIKDKIPMFIDKPITCTEKDAKAFMKELKENTIPVSGGSMCYLSDHVQALKKSIETLEYGKTLGGFLRAPVNMVNPYGNFFFYSQHLVQIMTAIYGCYPNSVQAFKTDDTITCVVRYNTFDVNLCFGISNYMYYAGINCEMAYVGSEFTLDNCSDREFMNYYHILTGKPQEQSYEDFFAPVYILNAINRSLESGKEEIINR